MPDPFPKGKSRTEPFLCKRCDHKLGYGHYVDGVLVALIAGGMWQTESHGYCGGCGCGVHITVPMKDIRKLLAHYGQDVGREIQVEFSGSDL